MNNGWLRVVYSDMLTASEIFKSQAPVFRAITEHSPMAFQGDCDGNLHAAIQMFLLTIDAAQDAISEGIYGHGVKLKLAHDAYDRAETATTVSAQGLFQALIRPDVIQ